MANDDTTKKALSLDGYVHIAQKERQIYATKAELPDVPVKSVKENGTALTPDANGAVDVTVPTAVSDLTNDSGFQANVIEDVKVNGTPLTVTNKAVDITIDTTAEENQDAFSGVKVGATTIAADDKTDTIEIVGGANVTVTADAANKKVTFAAADTTYSEATASAAGLMSASDKAKLDGVTSGAQPNVIEGLTVGGTALALDNKVGALGSAAAASAASSVANDATLPTGAAVKAFVEGKGYQTANDVAGAIEQAGHTTISEVESLGYQTADDVEDIVEGYGYQTASQVATAINTSLASVHEWKGTVATVAALPASGNKVGDTWHVTATGGEYSWDGSAWQELGTDYDFSVYMLKSDYVFASNAEIDAALGFTS